ncbi:MAG: HlyD family efflux transporter periplasmic adaptor subunit [Clostridia bacterium]|nr:HlyD family efflux transporter periplasmic adaptor subunit [Clostridia bacterium]
MANSKKKNRRRKTLSTVLILLAILIAGAAVGIKYLRQHVTENYGSKSSDEAQTATVTVGSISTTITGSGTLSAQETTDVSIPSTVALRSLCVEEGDTVTEGEILAYLDLTSVMSAMNDLQTELEELDSDIADAAKETVDNVMKSTVVGRVKGIYCEAGDSVLSIMYEHGALMTISLDGHMAVDIPTAGLSAGDTVTVTLSDGTAYPGTVDEVREDEAVVLITDNKPLLGDKATVTGEEGKTLGTGELYIHQPLNITGYAGTVSRLMVTENAPVTKNRILLYLTDTTFTANYDALLQQRAQVEDDLNELISLYRTGVVRAPLAGKVESITDEQETVEGAEVPAEWTFAVIRPQEKMIATASIDESNILSVEVGQTASVTISSISDDPFTGEVTSIEKTGTSTSGVTGYSVEVTLDRTEKMLTRMSATVSIRIEGVDDALLLPEDAVTKTRTSAYVYTSVNLTSGELEGMVEVQTGLTGGGYVEITKGLKEGDTVYYTKKQSNDFSSFMGGFGGGFGSGFGSGGFSMPGGGSGGGSGSGSGSGSSRPRGSRSGNSSGGQP